MIKSVDFSEETKSRFWRKIQKTTGCWLWTAAKNKKGYGIFGLGKQTDKAHRIAWRLIVGPIPAGLFVLHKCDVPNCVNPAHLFLGTNLDNVKDMIAKGRNSPPPPMGGWNRIVLSEESLLLLGKIPDTEIARKANVSKYVIQRLRRSRGIPALKSETQFKAGMPHPRWSRVKGVNRARS